MYKHRRERLLALIETAYGGERVRFCDKTGVSESRLAQLLSQTFRGGTAFTEKTARKLEAAADLPTLYFDQGAAPPLDEALQLIPGAKRVRAAEDGDPTMTAIRKARLRVRAGVTGFQVDPEHYDGETQLVPTEWMQREGFVPEGLISILVHGESMEPSLYEGDIIVINTRDTTPVSGSVFVINYEGEVIVKRMLRDAGRWWLTSDNPDQRRFHRHLCDGCECIIIGRVVRKESTHI